MSDAARKRAKRAKDRDLSIPPVADPALRAACLADPYLFLPTCFPKAFYQPFTTDRREMGDAILHAARYGGDQAVAGPRGDGKTRLALFGSFYLAVRRELQFPLIISKSGRRADRELRNLKDAIRDSDEFAALFPEVAIPIRALGGWSSRARQQTVFCQFTHLEWGENTIVLPKIDTALLVANGWNSGIDSASDGQIIASLGVEGPIRGFSVRNRRPDTAIIDDIDDRESAESETQTEDRERIIEEDIGGLAGPDKTISRVMLCTLLNHTCIAATYTDRTKKPSWKGQRHKLLETPPAREDLWAEYVTLRQSRAETDPDARVAHQFYLANRADMDAGAVVTNPYRFDSRPLSDGSQNEVSALQSYYNLVADRGEGHVKTEYQNDPPLREGPIASGLTSSRVQKQLSGYVKQVVPPECLLLTAGIDIGKWWLHWVICAWTDDGTGYVIDYGATKTTGATYGNDAGLDLVIHRAILELLEQRRATTYHAESGPMPIALTLVDASYRTDGVYSACSEAGIGVLPIMGFGKSEGGAARTTFRPELNTGADKRPGDGWWLHRLGRIWLCGADSDRWKSWVHDRWMTAPGNPGCLYLFGLPAGPGERFSADERSHGDFALQATAEVEIEEMVRGRLVRKWKHERDSNHLGDALYYAAVAANIKGIRLPMAATAKTTAPDRIPGQQPAPTAHAPSLAELARLAKAG